MICLPEIFKIFYAVEELYTATVMAALSIGIPAFLQLFREGESRRIAK